MARSLTTVPLMNTIPAIAALFLLMAGSVRADSIAFSSELIRTEYDFGDLAIAKIYDGRNLSSGPLHTVEIWRRNELIGRFGGVSFDDLAIAPDESYFVGISNSGHPGIAYLIIDALGNVRALQRHTTRLHYCEQSISVVRQWYDPENPDIQFETAGDGDNRRVIQISIMGCAGDRIQLLDQL